MSLRNSCSWCHASVRAEARECPSCGHDADRPRFRCSCSRCESERDGMERLMSGVPKGASIRRGGRSSL